MRRFDLNKLLFLGNSSFSMSLPNLFPLFPVSVFLLLKSRKSMREPVKGGLLDERIFIPALPKGLKIRDVLYWGG